MNIRCLGSVTRSQNRVHHELKGRFELTPFDKTANHTNFLFTKGTISSKLLHFKSPLYLKPFSTFWQHDSKFSIFTSDKNAFDCIFVRVKGKPNFSAWIVHCGKVRLRQKWIALMPQSLTSCWEQKKAVWTFFQIRVTGWKCLRLFAVAGKVKSLTAFAPRPDPIKKIYNIKIFKGACTGLLSY